MTKSTQKMICLQCGSRADGSTYCNKLKTNHLKMMMVNCPKNSDNWNLTEREIKAIEVLKTRFTVNLELELMR